MHAVGALAWAGRDGGLRSFSSGVLIGVLLVDILLFAPPARAVTCLQGGSGWEADFDGATHRGIKVSGPGVDVANFSPTCEIVRSMYVFQTGNNFVEVGWYDSGSIGGIAKCVQTSVPHIFVYAIVGNTIKCKNPSNALLFPSTVSGNVQNPDGDFNWDYYVDGVYQGFFNTNLTSGEVFAGTERHLYGDTLKAQFDGLQYMGTGGNWNPWTEIHGVRQPQTGDPVNDFSFCYDPNSVTHFQVKVTC